MLAVFPWQDLISSRRFPCFFTTMMVKGTNDLWKVRGLIDGFNELRKQISFGVVKTADN